jgi:hypothetical protein
MKVFLEKRRKDRKQINVKLASIDSCQGDMSWMSVLSGCFDVGKTKFPALQPRVRKYFSNEERGKEGTGHKRGASSKFDLLHHSIDSDKHGRLPTSAGDPVSLGLICF